MTPEALMRLSAQRQMDAVEATLDGDHVRALSLLSRARELLLAAHKAQPRTPHQAKAIA